MAGRRADLLQAKTWGDADRPGHRKHGHKGPWPFEIYHHFSSQGGNQDEEVSLGIEIAKPKDIVKDPYVFEFLGIPESKPFLEKDIEESLFRKLEDFFLELGRGFMYVGRQQRVTLNNTHYYVDMVFYNKILKSYVIIELKHSDFMPETVGQINMYLNYYKAEINDDEDNDPIGIILCTDKGNVNLEYALGGLSNQIFASKYTLYLPNKEELIKQVEMVLENNSK